MLKIGRCIKSGVKKLKLDFIAKAWELVENDGSSETLCITLHRCRAHMIKY